MHTARRRGVLRASPLAVCPAPSHLVPVRAGAGAAREGLSPRALLAGFPEDLRKCCHGDGTHPTPSQAQGLGLLVSGSLLSPPPRPPSLALQPRSCIAPWRPSSALSQASKCKGLSAAKSPKARGTYPATRPCSSPSGAGAVTPARLSSLLTAEASPSGRTCLSPGGFQVTRW